MLKETLMMKTELTANESPAPRVTGDPETRLSPLAILALSAWCGLAAGLLEVLANVLVICAGIDGITRATRHFVWIIPVADLCLFISMGAFLAVLAKILPRGGVWLSRLPLGGLALLPAMLVLFPRIHAIALMLVATGITSVWIAVFDRRPSIFSNLYRQSVVPLVVLVLLPSIWVFGGGALAAWRESVRLLPAAGSPNVLLIVLDTVRADHLSLYGYSRPTSPNLERLARRGICYNSARAPAPWTLPSHASMFTGRWPHELKTAARKPLDQRYPTLAEYLGEHGYATGGFVANMAFCTWGTGLSRGFTCYEDRVLSPRRFKMVRLADLCFQGALWFGEVLRNVSRLDLLTSLARMVFARNRFSASPHETARANDSSGHVLEAIRLVDTSSFADSHKEKYASEVNRQFLDWLSNVRLQRRPFFAFLNYFDAHDSYVPPMDFAWRFGKGPRTSEDYQVISDWSRMNADRPQRQIQLGLDAYDSCIAYLDQQIGKLIDELEQRGELERTLVIITSDHGEEFGEHGFIGHPFDLYRTQVHVPLLILLPGPVQHGSRVEQFVSLRDVPSTVVDVVGLESGCPFPGQSLARLSNGSKSVPSAEEGEEVISEMQADDAVTLAPSQTRANRNWTLRGRIVSLAVGHYVYIRSEENHTEELYDIQEDPCEKLNLVGSASKRETLDRLRQRFSSLFEKYPLLKSDARARR
jgi:arylsulfatase A-like enzyme